MAKDSLAEEFDDFGDTGSTGTDQKLGVGGGSSLQTILERDYKIEASDLGNPDSLVSSIMHFVVHSQYDRAVKELRAYQAFKAPYPTYAMRTDRIFDHVVNLINAIKAKKAFPNLATLPAPKRQELNEYISHHVKDLKSSLKKILKIELDLRQADSHTTLWVVQALILSVTLILGVAIALEAWNGMRAPAELMLSDLTKIIYRLFEI